MFGKNFALNDQTLPMIRELGRHMPGGFFIYRAEGLELLYVNEALLRIYGCSDQDDFRALTGYTFKGMVHPDDYEAVRAAIGSQNDGRGDGADYVEYRIRRRDGAVRWVEDHGQYTETEAYGGIHYVFISDITEKREQMESDMAIRQAVIEALSESYHTVWLINDVETGSFSLYRGDLAGSIHSAPIRDALTHMRFPQAKEAYINTTVAPSDRARLQEELSLETIAARLREKPQYNINYLRAMDDGSERYFRIEFAKVDMPGNRMGVVCGFKDVDDDVREGQAVQKALRDAQLAEEENRRLAEKVASAAQLADMMGSIGSLLTNMPAMSFSKDAATGVYLACNQSFAEYAHKESPAGVVGLTDHQIFDQATADHFVEDDRKALDMDGPYIFFEDVPDAAGNPRSFQTTKMKFTDDAGRLCTLGMCVDVTEMTRVKAREAEARVRQAQLEEKVALQEQLLAQEKERDQQAKLITALASDYWSVYYIELDRNRGLCYQEHPEVDHAVRQGEEFDYLEGFTAYANRYITGAYRDEFLAFIQPDAIREGLATERVISFRYLANRHGTEAYEMIRFAGVRHPEDRDDHLVHAVGACITNVDVETRKTLAQSQALKDALAVAEQANKAKTSFLSSMSHEIRTPMNAIIGLNSIALNDPETPPKTREYLEKMGASAQHLLSIINDILDMSRIESGRMTLHSQEFSLSKALEQVNTIIGGQCRDKGLRYDCRVRGRVDDYYIGDDMKLRQIMINILGNAVKFTPEGGTVTFTVEELNRYQGLVTLRLTMKDTGIGMSREYLPRLFDTFSQEDSSSTNRYGSTGLGMPITKSLVEMMNGKIEVESEKGRGSTFTVTLTLTESGRKAGAAEDGEIDPHTLHALIIDDDPIASEHAQIVLGQTGVCGDTASSGAEALEMVRMRHIRREQYNLILVDWRMPEMDGIETTRRIREAVGYETPVIILTSFNWDEIEEEARAAGVDGFVHKPLFAAGVLDAYRDAMKTRSPERSGKPADLAGRRILLAEDMAVNAEIMMMVLNAREMQAELAENGRVAVERFSGHEPGYYDAILMDMRMPEMDGLEATRRIRAMDRADAKTIPIIALTANAFDEDVQRSMQAGLNAHLSKPVSPDALYEALENLIRD